MTISFACMPPCKRCREADSCETQQEIDYKRDHRKPPRWPDALAGSRMACGCRCDLMPYVLGIRAATHVMCETHGWQPLTRPQEQLEAEQQLELPPF